MTKFGTETQGGTDQAIAANFQLVNSKACGFTGIIYSISAYIKNAAAGEYFRFTVYTNSGSAPLTLVGKTQLLEGTGVDGWITAELDQPIAVASGTYWLGVHARHAITVVHDSGSENSRNVSDTFSDWPMTTWAGGTNETAREYSIYADTEFSVSTRRWIGYKSNLSKTYDGFFDSYGAEDDAVMLSKVIAVEDLTIESIWGYITDVWTAGMYARAVVYSDSGGSPDALLKQSDPIQGAGTEQWYSADLQSTLNITSGTTYWIGWQADSNSTSWMEAPYGDMVLNCGYYTVADTYSDGPEDPCNSPAGDSDTKYEHAYYAEAALPPSITFDATVKKAAVSSITADAIVTHFYVKQSGVLLVL